MEGASTSARGLSVRFVELETLFNGLRGEVIEAISDGKLTLTEVTTIRYRLDAVAVELDYMRGRLQIVEDSIKFRS